MNECLAKKGFLSLSTCGATATRPCSACGLMTCPDHLSPASGFNQCLSCANANRSEPIQGNTLSDDPDIRYQNRSSYYSGRGDTRWDSFDSSDSRAFHRAAMVGGAAAQTDEDDGHPGFGDS